MLLMGAIFAHLAVCGALMRTAGGGKPRTNAYQRIPSDAPSSTHQPSFRSGCFLLWKGFTANLDLSLLWNPRFWTVATLYGNVKFVFDMWSIYFVSATQSNGYSVEEAAVFVTVGGVGSLIAKISQGFIVDRGFISCWWLMSVSMVISSAAYCATPWLTSYWAMMTATSLILITDGLFTCLTDVLTKQVLGVDLLAGAYGWTAIVATVFQFAISFLPGR